MAGSQSRLCRLIWLKVSQQQCQHTTVKWQQQQQLQQKQEAIIYNKMQLQQLQQQHLPLQQQQQQLSVRPVFNTLQNQNVTPASVVAVAVVAAAVKVKLKFTWPVQHLGQFELLAMCVCVEVITQAVDNLQFQ